MNRQLTPGMRHAFRILRLAASAFALLIAAFPGFAQIDSFDSCIDTNTDVSLKVHFTSSRYTASFTSVVVDSETNMDSGSYEIISTPDIWSDDPQGDQRFPTLEFMCLYLGYGCGSYYDHGLYPQDIPLPLSSLANAYLDGTSNSNLVAQYADDFIDWGIGISGQLRTLDVIESHSDHSFSISVTVTSTETNSGAHGTLTVKVSGQLDGAYIPTKETNDGKDRKPTCGCGGMPVWGVSEPYINLWVMDKPAFYTTSLGKPLEFELSYKQRDTRPVTNAVMAARGGWSHNWFSYVHFSVPTYVAGRTFEAATPTHTSPRGVTIYSDWILTNDFFNWSAILYAPDNGENYFSRGLHTEYPSGLSLLPMDGVDEHFYPYGPDNPHGESYYGKVGFRLVHPDGSQDIYGRVAGGRQTWGIVTNAGRIYDSLFRPADTATYRSNWVEGLTWPINGDDQLPGGPVGYLAGDALLTERIDPDGNSIQIYYGLYGPNEIVDYDGNYTFLSYNSDGTLSRVDMPYGRSAIFSYTNVYYTNFLLGVLTNTLLRSITDAEGMTSFFGYSYVWTNAYLSSITTPYGTTTFTHADSTNAVLVTQPPWFQIVPGSMSIHTPGTLHHYVGALGRQDMFNRAVSVTHPDGSHELFAYRYDSSAFLATNYPPESIPYAVVPGTDDGLPHGADTNVPIHARVSTRNSFHWDRAHGQVLSQQTLDYPTNFAGDEMFAASISHWLAENDFNLSGQISSFQAAPPGAPMTWFDYSGKSNGRWNESTFLNSSVDVSAIILPDGSTNYTRSTTYEGLPFQVDKTYTDENGHVAERSWYFGYEPALGRQDCSDGTTAYWYYFLPSYISSPVGGLWLNQPSPVTNVWFSYFTGPLTYTNIIPRRLQLEVRDAEDNVTTIYHNLREQVTGIHFPEGPTITNVYYGTNGFLTSSTVLDTGATSTFTFSNGLPRSITSPLGLQVLYDWDKLDRLKQISFPDGTSVQNVYDKLDVVAHKDRLNHWTYAAFNNMDDLVSATDPNGHTNHFSWCSCGALSSITDPLGHYTTFNRDLNGNVTSITPSTGLGTVFTRDGLGRVTHVTSGSELDLSYSYNHQGLVTNVSSPAGRVAGVLFDLGDRPIRVTGATGITITNEFDYIGRLVSRTDPLGHSESFVYSPARLAEYHDPLGHVTSYGYSAGLLAAVTNANLEVTQFGYDPAGDLTSLTDARGFTKHWLYDAYGHQTAEINANGATVRTAAYGPNGRVTNSWSAARGSVSYAYDNAGNLLTLRSPRSTLSFTYDHLGQMLSFSNEFGLSQYSYNYLGALDSLLASESGPWSGDTVSYGYTNHNLKAISLGSWTNRIAYDSNFRPASFTSPAGTFTYSYNGASMQIASLQTPSATSSHSYDAAGRPSALTSINGQSSTINSFGYTYDPAGFITNITRLGSISSDYSYDPIGQLTSAVAHDPSNVLRKNENLGYAYDPSGNLAWRTNNTLIQSFVSDGLNELTNILRSGALTVSGSVTGSVASLGVNGQHAELYTDGTFASADGFILTNAQNWFLINATNGSNQMVISSLLKPYLPSTMNVKYDPNGNLLTDGQRYFEWNDFDELTAVTVSNTWRSEFDYDALGRRRVARDYSWLSSYHTWDLINETRYVYDGMLPIQERASNNDVLATYTRGLDLSSSMGGAGGIGGLLARSQGSTHYHFVSDHGGNITTLLTTNGSIAARYLYDPYGNLLGKWGPQADANLDRFSSKQTHLTSGLIYYGFRWYDPNLQRWLNEDPIGEAGGMNVHGFVENSPLTLADAYGLRSISDLFDSISIGGANPMEPLSQILQGARNWAGDQGRQVGQGTYDLMMGDNIGHPDANTYIANRNALLGGIDPENNFIRDAAGYAGYLTAEAAAVAAEALLTKGIGESEGVGGLGSMCPKVKSCNLRRSPQLGLSSGQPGMVYMHPPKGFDIVPYSRSAVGFEKHHGVLDAWARANVPGYVGGGAPTMVLTPSQHNATRAVFNAWRAENGWARQALDWTRVSPQEIHALTYRMFRAAGVPAEAISNYLRSFHQYIYGL